MKTHFTITALAAATAVIAAASGATAGSYDGKAVTVIVNAGAGGGLTRTGRMFTETMKTHLGNDTNMVIKNIPGGGGVKGLNFFAEKVKPDGMTLLWGTPNQMAKLLALPGVRYDPKDMIVIISMASAYVSLARADAVKTPADVVKAKTLIVGGRSTTDSLGIFARLPLDVLGVKYRYVPGYNAQPKMNAAIRAKEIQSLTTGHVGYIAFYEDTIIKSGEAIPLYYHSPINKIGQPQRLAYMPASIKHFVDVYRDINGGKDPTGLNWEAYKWFSTYSIWPFSLFAPKGTPPALVKELRDAAAKAVKDPAFLAEHKKRMRSEPNYLIGDDAQFILSDYTKISPAAREGLKKLTARKRQ